MPKRVGTKTYSTTEWLELEGTSKITYVQAALPQAGLPTMKTKLPGVIIFFIVDFCCYFLLIVGSLKLLRKVASPMDFHCPSKIHGR